MASEPLNEAFLKFIATDASKLPSQASEQIYYGTGDGK